MAPLVEIEVGMGREKARIGERNKEHGSLIYESESDVVSYGSAGEALSIGVLGDESGIGSARKGRLRTRSRHHRICHLGRSSRSHRHHSDHDIPPQIAGTVGCDSSGDIGTIATDRSKDRIGRFVALRDLVTDCVSKLEVESGQGTVEYALILSACLAVVVGIGMLMGSIEDGVFVEHVVTAASHNVEVLLGGAADVFSY